MPITLQGLLDADTGQLDAVARHWDKLARTLDLAVEDLGRDTREMPNHWPAGPSSQAAQDKAAELRVRVGNGQTHCAAVGRIIRNFALDLEQGRYRLNELVAEARAAGLQVDLAAGRITAPIAVAATQGTVDGYAQQIGEVLTFVNNADREATEALAEHTYREDVLPDAEQSRFDDISIMALANWMPESQTDYWKGLHSLHQERAIAEFPTIIGNARGLPAQDRDAANRLRLNRVKDELLATRARQDEAHDGAMNQAQINLDARLATIADLERRSQGRHLISYEPGFEQEAELAGR
ncbi:hypothetical protein M1L60_21685 [Actinoplanes sp. TRM 88003]|uniref:Uncharacterized protein n=1 Tax=Paractinoplanes aksuensis TaxID=2939490 RepID=A0ABT1DQT8_9ACTN|nr:hypothetical protein [Actinoplanes aksuensis]MCO8273207.1 hypothetical protein [Actinoplanes aksuensis]